MNILIIGSGGREHALAWKVGQSSDVTRIYVAPGNAGTAAEPNTENVRTSVDDIPALVSFAVDKRVDLTIVGPEAPLVGGVVDAFHEAGLRCFGPTAGAAQLEGSKAFTKDFLRRHGIPTAAYETFTVAEQAADYIRAMGAPIVVKADGLAAGKGVVLARTEAEAILAVQNMLVSGQFGEAGRRVVVEELLTGEEASFIVMVDGEHILPMASSQDHKAIHDGDAGPNTGGMGAYSPAPVVTAAIHERIMREVIEPTVRGMAADGLPYTGFLYAGLMIASDGTPRVLEYNCRLGDPETQPIMMRLRSDLVGMCQAALSARLEGAGLEWDPRASLGVVLAAGGYPGEYRKGDPIRGLDRSLPDTKVFHAGTRASNGQVETAGGRVLCVCALGESVTDAQALAYDRVATIGWDGMYCRRDIGYRAVEREAAGG